MGKKERERERKRSFGVQSSRVFVCGLCDILVHQPDWPHHTHQGDWLDWLPRLLSRTGRIESRSVSFRPTSLIVFWYFFRLEKSPGLSDVTTGFSLIPLIGYVLLLHFDPLACSSTLMRYIVYYLYRQSAYVFIFLSSSPSSPSSKKSIWINKMAVYTVALVEYESAIEWGRDPAVGGTLSTPSSLNPGTMLGGG